MNNQFHIWNQWSENYRGNSYFWHKTQPACIQFNMARNYIQTVLNMLRFSRKRNQLICGEWRKQHKIDPSLQNRHSQWYTIYRSKALTIYSFNPIERENWVIYRIHTSTQMRQFLISFQSRKIRSFSILFPKQYLSTHFTFNIHFCAPFSHLR